jgi:hypothetical protein
LALEGEGFADHHERLAAGLAVSIHFNGLTLTLLRDTFIFKFLKTGALGRSIDVVLGQVSVVLLVDQLASLGLLFQTARDLLIFVGSRASLGVQL